MKFAAKLSLAVILLLAATLSLGGFVLLRQNFDDSLALAEEQNLEQHRFERYSLQRALQGLDPDENADEALLRYMATLDDYLGSDRRMLALYGDDYREIYTNFPGNLPAEARLEALEAGGGKYQLVRAEGGAYMLVASYVSSPYAKVWLLSGYDVGRVFAQRDAQLQNLWRIEGAVLVAAAVVLTLLAHLLTRPIRRLNRASRQIASGAYTARTGVRSSDEIGELSRNFDTMAAAVEEQVEALNRSVSQRDDFVSAFSHELKTPMTSIIGYADIMRSMRSDEKTRHIAANHIYHEARRLEALSQKLLRLMGLSQQAVEPLPVAVDSIYATVWRSLQPMPQGIRLTFQPCEAVVLADKDLVVDLLRNLILNACKACEGGGRVQVLARPRDGRCLLAVQDDGCGIPPEEIARITEPFYMVDKSRSREAGGTGIGLALCQQIALAHGSALDIQSVPGEGTQVWFSLALAPAPEPAEGEEDAP